MLNSGIDRAAKNVEIDRLREELHGTPLDGLLSRAIIPIGGDHDHWNIRPHFPHLRKHIEARHAGHIDVRQDEDQRPCRSFRNPRKGIGSGASKLHLKALGPQIATETLPKEIFDIFFIINNEDENTHDLPPLVLA